MNIFILGAYPPPIGGITIHVQRLFNALKKNGHQVYVFDFGGQDSLQKPDEVLTTYHKIFKRIRSIDRKEEPKTLVHVHVSAMGKFRWYGPILITLFRKYPKVITIHSGSFIQKADEMAKPGYIKWLINSFDQIITVNQEQKEYLTMLKIPEKKLTVIPAFLFQEPKDNSLPEAVERLRKEKEILVITSGHCTPLYNYEILIDVINRLPIDKYGFIFAFYTQYEQLYEEHILSRLSQLQNTLILRDQSPEEYLTLLNICDIYVRSTFTDGDSIAVREALQLGKVVFASDSVKRPESCQLFSAEDAKSLMALFEQYQSETPSPACQDSISGIISIVAVYQKAHAGFLSKR